MISYSGSLLLLLTSTAPWSMVSSFSSPIFQAERQLTFPTKTEGVEIELPNFDELFGRLQQVSPLTKIAIDQEPQNKVTDGKTSHFDFIQDALKWTVIEQNKNGIVRSIEKIDNFQGLGCPILRFRAQLEGPCVGDVFATFIMDLDQRSQWDPAINQVYEAYPISDLDLANVLMGMGKYGDCRKLGVGYCQTKSYLAVSGREQLTLCGLQDFFDGSAVIWGTEMEERHNHLLPDHPRVTRSKSHLFSTTLVPTGPNTFDVEYILQIDIGGKLPGWITTPILCETVKSMFRYSQEYLTKNKGNVLANLEKMDHMEERDSILMTP